MTFKKRMKEREKREEERKRKKRKRHGRNEGVNVRVTSSSGSLAMTTTVSRVHEPALSGINGIDDVRDRCRGRDARRGRAVSHRRATCESRDR